MLVYVNVWKGSIIQEWICPTKSLISSPRYSNLNVSHEQIPLQTHAEKQALLRPIIYHNPCLSDDKLLSPKGPILLIKCVMCIFQQFVVFKGWRFVHVFFFPLSLLLEILNVFLEWYFLSLFWILQDTVPASLVSYIIVSNWGCCYSDTEDRNLVKSRKLSFKSQKVPWFIAI